MTAPKRDGRRMIDRCRELAKLDCYPFHERSTEGLDALCWLLNEYDVLTKAVHLEFALEVARKQGILR